MLYQIRLTAERPGLQEPAARDCARGRIDGMPEGRFRSLAHGWLSEREEAVRPLINLILVCLAEPGTGPGGQSYLRAQLEQESLDFARGEGGNQATLVCICHRLRSEISDMEIVEHVKPSSRVAGELS